MITRISRRGFLRLSGAAAIARGVPLLAQNANASLCHKLANDPLRPQYHLLPAHNWMNDPNGPIFFGGRYHMFHQYNPQGATWGNMNWAHATSADLIHWQHQPIALSPTPGSADQDGVFSGSAVLDNGRPAIIYTGVAPPTSEAEATLRDGAHTWRETQCMAIAEDNDLFRWKKLPEPVIPAPPGGLAVTGFRDPCLWREGDRWMLILGSGTREKGGMILLYSSPDLRHWTYLHPLIVGSPSGKQGPNPVDTGDMWECPDFFPLAGKHVLLISTMGKVRWKVGTYKNQRFTAEKEGVVDWGSYYAAKTMLDRDGNRILWGWIPEARPDAQLLAAGWAGAMSLPRTMSLNADDELQSAVAPIAKTLRAKPETHLTGTVRQQDLDQLRLRDLAVELNLLLQPKSENSTIRLHSDSGEFAAIAIENSSQGRRLRVDNYTAPLPGTGGSPVHLRLFLDGSVLEIFADGVVALTARVYQIPSGPLQLHVEGSAHVVSLDTWQMTPISNDRLTESWCASH